MSSTSLISLTFGCATVGSLVVELAAFSAALAAPETDLSPKPVETDIHEFMEAINEPHFKSLKSAMQEEASANRDWSTIQSSSLTLAEVGNLLLFRGPKQQEKKWQENAVSVRESGSELYQAAQAKDTAAASKHYKAMVESCNACHRDFANGEYQLKP